MNYILSDLPGRTIFDTLIVPSCSFVFLVAILLCLIPLSKGNRILLSLLIPQCLLTCYVLYQLPRPHLTAEAQSALRAEIRAAETLAANTQTAVSDLGRKVAESFGLGHSLPLLMDNLTETVVPWVESLRDAINHLIRRCYPFLSARPRQPARPVRMATKTQTFTYNPRQTFTYNSPRQTIIFP